jgi:uncharacterized phiE125 gp8 family phage protein
MFDASGRPIHFSVVVTTDAVTEPISVADAKLFLRVDNTVEDRFIADGITECRRLLERMTGRALLTQTRTMTLDVAPSGRKAILLPCAPVASVTSITQYSTADVGTTVATSVYRLDTSSLPPRIVLKDGQSWPSGLRPQNALSIEFVCGYGDGPEDITDPELVHALRLLLQQWYERTPNTPERDYDSAVETLIGGLKVPWL